MIVDISDCPICMNVINKDASNNPINIGITSCGHIFCLSCIIKHSKRKYTCPMCRSEFIDPTQHSQDNMEENNVVTDWVFTSWQQQLDNINMTSQIDTSQIYTSQIYTSQIDTSQIDTYTTGTTNSITLQNLSIDLCDPHLISTYISNEETIINPLIIFEPEPEENIIIEIMENEIYDCSITIHSDSEND
jgi:hypothetical protein